MLNDEILRDYLSGYLAQAQAHGNAEQLANNLRGLVHQLSAHPPDTEEDREILAHVETAWGYMETLPPWWKDTERCLGAALSILLKR